MRRPQYSPIIYPMTDANNSDRPTLPPVADYESYIEQEVALSTHPYYVGREQARDYVRAIVGDETFPENPTPCGCEGVPL